MMKLSHRVSAMGGRNEAGAWRARIKNLLLLACSTISLLIHGCGGSMGSSSSGWGVASVVAYGNPVMEIVRDEGAPNNGHFEIESSSATFRAGDVVFVEATYTAEVPNVNERLFTDETPPVGTFRVEWSEVLPTADAQRRVTFNSPSGVTFTEMESSANPNVRLTGLSGTFIKVSTPGPVTLRFRVTLQLSDGSSRSKEYETTLVAEPVDGV